MRHNPGKDGHPPRCVCAMTSASRCAAPLPPLCVEDEDVVDVVEPWMAWLIQCSMLMLPWLEVGVPCESPCTEPSSSEPEEVSAQGEKSEAFRAHGEGLTEDTSQSGSKQPCQEELRQLCWQHLQWCSSS